MEPATPHDKNRERTETAEVVVVGGGLAGLVAAITAAATGNG